MAIDVLVIDPPRVNPSALDSGISVLFHAIAVVHLHLIAALQVNPRVRVFGDAEFDVQLDIAELRLGQ